MPEDQASPQREDTDRLEDDLARAGKVFSRFPVEHDLELRVLRTSVLGTEFVVVADYVPSEDRYQRSFLVERRHLRRLIKDLVALDRHLGGSSLESLPRIFYR